MSILEKLRKRNYERTIEELEQRRRSKKITAFIMLILYLIMCLAFAYMALLSTNWITLAEFPMGLLALYFSALIYLGVFTVITAIYYLDFLRDIDIIEMYIFLKMEVAKHEEG